MSAHFSVCNTSKRRSTIAAAGRWLAAVAVCTALAGCAWGRSVAEKSAHGVRRFGERMGRIASGEYDDRTDSFMAGGSHADDDVAGAVRQAGHLSERGDARGAIHLLESASREAPQDADTQLQLASLLAADGRLVEAAIAVDAALAAEPHHIDALLLKAELAEARQRSEDAIAIYHQVLAESPGHVVARLRVAELELQGRHPERAAPLLRAVCESPQATPGQRAEARWSLGIAYGREGRWNDAVLALAAAAAERPHMTPDDWCLLAEARRRTGDIAGARRDLRHALELQPHHPAASAMHADLGTAKF